MSLWGMTGRPGRTGQGQVCGAAELGWVLEKSFLNWCSASPVSWPGPPVCPPPRPPLCLQRKAELPGRLELGPQVSEEP